MDSAPVSIVDSAPVSIVGYRAKKRNRIIGRGISSSRWSSRRQI